MRGNSSVGKPVTSYRVEAQDGTMHLASGEAAPAERG
jgi:hypothetical protein